MFLVEQAYGSFLGHAVTHDHADDGAADLGEGLVCGELLSFSDVVVHAKDDLAVDGGVADIVRADGLDLVWGVVGVGFADEDLDTFVLVGLGEVLVVLDHLV